MARIKVEKTLVVQIKATARKRRELERALRVFIDNYKDKRGVYEIKVTEENVEYREPIKLSEEDRQAYLDEQS